MLGHEILVTIGIPFYNNEKTLQAAINSVLMQTYTNWELLLINDGSTDSSLKISQGYADRDSRITLINDSQNKGLIYRLNQIIDLSNGSFIARMDSDDMMMPERIEKQLKCFQANPNIDIVATAAYIIDQNNNPLGLRDMNPILAKSAKEVINKSLLIHPSILANTQWYRKNRYSSEFIRAEDYELWCRTFSHTNFFRLVDPLLIYREGNVNIANYKASMITLRKIIKKYGPLCLTPFELQTEIVKTYLKSMLYSISGTFKLQYLLTKQRNKTLNRIECMKVEKVIKEITSFKLVV